MKPKPLSPYILIERGSCCGNQCQNCPYVTDKNERQQSGTATLNKDFLLFLKNYPQKQWPDFILFLSKK